MIPEREVEEPPLIQRDLVLWIEKQFGRGLPRPGESLSEIMYLSGWQAALEMLAERYYSQQVALTEGVSPQAEAEEVSGDGLFGHVGMVE